MENLFTKKIPLYFETEEMQLVLDDSFKILTKIEPESVDMIFADPPYFLSNEVLLVRVEKWFLLIKAYGISFQKVALESKKNTSLTESGLSYVKEY